MSPSEDNSIFFLEALGQSPLCCSQVYFLRTDETASQIEMGRVNEAYDAANTSFNRPPSYESSTPARLPPLSDETVSPRHEKKKKKKSKRKHRERSEDSEERHSTNL